jgi:hypothetical protein
MVMTTPAGIFSPTVQDFNEGRGLIPPTVLYVGGPTRSSANRGAKFQPKTKGGKGRGRKANRRTNGRGN